MARNLNRLTAKQVATAKPGVHQDGGGLRLLVTESGAKRWALRMTYKGERIDIGLGSASTVTLAEARRKAAEARAKAEEGADPRGNAASTIVTHRVTFKEASEATLAVRLDSYRNAKHRAQWRSTLETYCYPIIGDVPVADLASGDILKVLGPIWLSKCETASRIRQRISIVLQWAVAAGHRSADKADAARVALQGLPKQPRRSRHLAALPWQELPAFVADLRAGPSIPAVRLGAEFLVLTATRTSETLLATWQEIDLDAAIWTIPGERMKAPRDHRVPLSTAAKAVLVAARSMWRDLSPYVFPGRRTGAPLSDQSFLMAVRRLSKGTATTHGFRSSFRDWAADNGQSRELAEAALAHTLGKVEGAYRRSDLLEARRPLMEAWGEFVTGGR